MISNPGRLPDFLIIGAAKSGTSSLHRYLSDHPKAFGSNPKEPCFFDEAVNWHRGFDWYRGLFADSDEDQLCFESSTNYTRYPQVPKVPERIAACMPKVKLIYLMRHPVERAYSHYVHRFTKEVYPQQPIDIPFEEFVREDPMCLDGSDYAMQIDRYLEYFERSQLLLLTQDELETDPSALLAKVQAFLGLPAIELVPDEPVTENVSSSFREIVQRRKMAEAVRSVPGMTSIAARLPTGVKQVAYEALSATPWGTRTQQMFEPPPMRPETRLELATRYAPSVDRLAALMGEDLTSWRS